MRKKATILVLAAGVMLLASCLKDGFNDFDAFNHPMHITGEAHPELGVPVAYGEVNLWDMIQMVQTSNASFELNSADVITLVYRDSTSHWDFDMQESKVRREDNGRKEAVFTSRRFIAGEVEIDLFDSIGLSNAELEVDSILVYLSAYIKGESGPGADTLTNREDVHIYYDSITLKAVGEDGIPHTVLTSGTTRYPVDSILEGETVLLLDNENVNLIVNSRPKRFTYTARLNFGFEPSFFAHLGTTVTDTNVSNLLDIQSVSVDPVIQVRFPISLYANNLEYTTSMEFTVSERLEDFEIDSSMLYLKCTNGLPLSFFIDGQLLGPNGTVLCELVNDTVEGGSVSQVGDLYVVTNPTESVVGIPLTRQVYDALMECTAVRLHGRLNTSSTGNAGHKCVAIRNTDFLGMNIYALLRPRYTFDIELNAPNGKGGAQ